MPLVSDTVALAPVVPVRAVRAAVGWAAAGVAVLAVSVWSYASWVAAGQAHRVGTGADAVPAHVKAAVVTFEVVSTLAAVAAIAHVGRRCARDRRLTLDAMILIAWFSAWWHDPLLNWLRPTVFYNAYALNLGSWTEQVPGWFSPHAHTLPEPVLVIGTVYVWMGLLCAVTADRIMSGQRRRRPVVRFGLAFAGVLAFEVVMEVIATRLHLVGYPSSIHSLTLWAGHTYQLPVYEMVAWSLVLTSVGALRHGRDAHGRTVVERGGQGAVVRLLAVIGFVNVVALSYDVVLVATSVHAGQVATYPTWLRTGQCGPGTTVPCPGPGVPLVSR